MFLIGTMTLPIMGGCGLRFLSILLITTGFVHSMVFGLGFQSQRTHRPSSYPIVTGAVRPAYRLLNTKGFSSTKSYLAMGFANVRAGTTYRPSSYPIVTGAAECAWSGLTKLKACTSTAAETGNSHFRHRTMIPQWQQRQEYCAAMHVYFIRTSSALFSTAHSCSTTGLKICSVASRARESAGYWGRDCAHRCMSCDLPTACEKQSEQQQCHDIVVILARK